MERKSILHLAESTHAQKWKTCSTRRGIRNKKGEYDKVTFCDSNIRKWRIWLEKLVLRNFLGPPHLHCIWTAFKTKGNPGKLLMNSLPNQMGHSVAWVTVLMAARRTTKPCLRLRARIFFNSLVIPRGNPGRQLEGPRGGGGAVLDGAPRVILALHGGGVGFGGRRPGRRIARSCGRKEKVEDCRFRRSSVAWQSPELGARMIERGDSRWWVRAWVRDLRNFHSEQETNSGNFEEIWLSTIYKNVFWKCHVQE